MSSFPVTIPAMVFDHAATGAALRETRKAKGLTARQLAERTGLTEQAISLLENGRRDWSADLVAKIEAALNA